MPSMPLEGSGRPRACGESNGLHLTERPLCGNCKMKEPIGGEKFKACQRCMFIRYCSRDCQRAHWKAHKQVCKNITKIVQNQEPGNHSIDKMMKCKQDATVKHQSQVNLHKAVKAAKAPWYTVLSHNSSSEGEGEGTPSDSMNVSIDESSLDNFMSKIYLFSSGFVCKNLSLNRGKGCLFLYANVSWDKLTGKAGKNSKKTKKSARKIEISLAWGWDNLRTIRRKGGLYAGKLIRMLPYNVPDEMIFSRINKCSLSSFPLIVVCDPTSEHVLDNIKDTLIEQNGGVQEGDITQLVVECRILDPVASKRYAQRMPETEILCFNFGS